ncbi:hypothetical protein O181_072340 [Austropuccinia psidii MF-1]|uniref:Uncharacterized protein n=1 Tax=Austropuccinia psidii MF-1 TaxID=1389203 RepID=A0A9Q3F8I1_9BASI|nr:hypothetical protein [Austropuccinia psidii MF-1]
MQDLLSTQRKKNGKRREKTSYTPGASPSEPTLPRHVRPEDSPISPTPSPRATSTPKTAQISQGIPIEVFWSIPSHLSPLQKEIPKVNSPIFKIRAKYYNFVFDGNEVEKFIKRIEAAAEIEGANGEDIAMKVIFMSVAEAVKEKIKPMQGY